MPVLHSNSSEAHNTTLSNPQRLIVQPVTFFPVSYGFLSLLPHLQFRSVLNLVRTYIHKRDNVLPISSSYTLSNTFHTKMFSWIDWSPTILRDQSSPGGWNELWIYYTHHPNKYSSFLLHVSFHQPSLLLWIILFTSISFHICSSTLFIPSFSFDISNTLSPFLPRPVSIHSSLNERTHVLSSSLNLPLIPLWLIRRSLFLLHRNDGTHNESCAIGHSYFSPFPSLIFSHSGVQLSYTKLYN